MNKFINAVLLFLFLPTLLYSLIVGFDLPITIIRTSGANLPYRELVFLSLGLLFLMIVIRRSIRRWVGLAIISKTNRFLWNMPVSKERKKRVYTYSLLESSVMFFAGLGLYVITEEAWLPALALVLAAVDGVVFTLFGSSCYRVGLSGKALMIADREVIVLYFTGLRKVGIHQQSIYFDYIKGLQLSFPLDCIPAEERSHFFTVLESVTDPKQVYFHHLKG